MSNDIAEEVPEQGIIEDQVDDIIEVESEAEVEDDGDVVVSIGDEPLASEEEEHAQAPAWVKELRKSHKEILKENRDLKEKIKSSAAPVAKEVVLGPKPKIDDFDFDPEKHEAALDAWYDRRDLVKAKEQEAKAEQDLAAKAWEAQVSRYQEAKTKLRVPDYDEAESTATETLSKVQQGIIVQGADNPALVVYALGKNPAKAKELAAITDPVKYAFAVAKLESQLKVSKRSAPAPEKKLSFKTTSTVGSSADSALERLRAEADRTGDHSKVMAYRHKLRNQKRG